MKRSFLYLGLVALVMCSGCATTSDGTVLDTNTKKGAAIGALTGAAIGGIAGHQDGHGWEGALIGAAAGTVGGAVVGKQMDKNSETVNAMPVTQIVEMTKSGVPDDVIISEIDRTGSRFDMTMSTISYLQDNGVSDKVIDYMLEVSK